MLIKVIITVTTVLISALTAASAVLSFLLRDEKRKNRILQEEVNTQYDYMQSAAAVHNMRTQKDKEQNERRIKAAKNSRAGFDAAADMLRDISKAGRNRNSGH